MAKRSRRTALPRGADGTRKRAVAVRDPIPSMLIVCEGAKTEPNYFDAFDVTMLQVRVEGTGTNTVSLVELTRTFADGQGFDQVWCVFDRDSFSAADFNTAIERATNYGYRVAWSNECFELWYVLHFAFMDSGQERSLYYPRLTECLGATYAKNSVSMYDALLSRQSTAIKNAKKLWTRYDPEHNPAADNPCTTVFELVEELNKHLRGR